MKTIFHDKESGTKLEMEGTFTNSKAQVVDNEGKIGRASCRERV